MMLRHDSATDIHAGAAFLPGVPTGLAPRAAGLHGRAAWAAALEDGLLRAEIRGILAGRRMVDAFPVRSGEAPQTYAARAVAEMMIAYLG